MPKEGFCCTCGKVTTGDYILKPDSDNPSTMCDECTEEVGNFCCKCKLDMKSLNTSMTICSSCMGNEKIKTDAIADLEKVVDEDKMNKIKEILEKIH